MDPHAVARRRWKLIEALGEIADCAAVVRLSAFVKRAWHILNPGRTLIWNWHHTVACEHLEAVTRGQLRKVIFNMPPGNMKTTIMNCWVVWELLRKPEYRYISVSYSDDLSKKSAGDRRKILNSEWYLGLRRHAERVLGVPFWTLASEAVHEATTTRGGWVLATSINGQGTGRHGDRVLFDDVLKAGGIYTVELETHVRAVQETFMSRATDVKATAYVLFMQRLHKRDIAGVFEEDPDWCLVKMPALYEAAKSKVNSFGWKDPRTIEGEPLFPARFPREYLEKQRGPFGIGPIAFAAQQQQDPVAGEGNIFKGHWWRHWWTPADGGEGEAGDRLPDKVDRVIASWDMTFKGEEASDFVVGQVWAQKGADMYLLDQVRARLDFLETEKAFLNMRRKWPMVSRWLVEEKANGAAIISRLRRIVPGIIPIVPRESKAARARAVSGFVESGNVYLPPVRTLSHWGGMSQHWVQMFIEEASAFPAGHHDDQVDAMTQALTALTFDMKADFTLPAPGQGREKAVQSPLLPDLDRQADALQKLEKAAARKAKRASAPPGLRSARSDPYTF